MEYKKSECKEIKVKLPDEERIKLYGDKLKEKYTGKLYNTIAHLFKHVIGVNVIVPGGSFTR